MKRLIPLAVATLAAGLLTAVPAHAAVTHRILFDNTKAETAGERRLDRRHLAARPDRAELRATEGK